MFRSASENNIDLYADSVNAFIKKCIGDDVPTVTIKTYPNQKPWKTTKTKTATSRTPTSRFQTN